MSVSALAGRASGRPVLPVRGARSPLVTPPPLWVSRRVTHGPTCLHTPLSYGALSFSDLCTDVFCHLPKVTVVSFFPLPFVRILSLLGFQEHWCPVFPSRAVHPYCGITGFLDVTPKTQ